MATTNEAHNNLINKRILEIKKKTFLIEGRKKTLAEQFDQKKKTNQQIIQDLKIKIQNYKSKKCNNDLFDNKQSCLIQFPPNAKSLEETLYTYDLSIADLTNQFNAINYRYKRTKEHDEYLLQQYTEKLELKDAAGNGEQKDSSAAIVQPQSTEKDEYRKMYCQLENKVNRTMIALVEAEHIRKKYKLIKSSLSFDAEKFEKYLLEMKRNLENQQADIKRFTDIHEEALKMRDATRLYSVQQENMSCVLLKSRQNDSDIIQKEAEEKKIEMEKLERKLFETKKPVTRQSSSESVVSDMEMLNRIRDINTDDQDISGMPSKIADHIKYLVIITGTTSPHDVLQRFIIQKETSSRLNYLRTITESDKKQLEAKRDRLRNQMDLFKFSDVKENEVNQEYTEKLKNVIQEEQNREADEHHALQHSIFVLNDIRTVLLNLSSRYNEINEMMFPNEDPAKIFINNNLSCENFIQILERELVKVFDTKKQPEEEEDDLMDRIMEAREKKLELEFVRLSDKDRYTHYPTYYTSLLTRRAACGTASLSSGQSMPQGMMDEDGEVPTRTFLKNQAVAIVEVKSRRKGYRNVPKRK